MADVKDVAGNTWDSINILRDPAQDRIENGWQLIMKRMSSEPEMPVASGDAKKRKEGGGADWEESFVVGVATEDTGAAGLLTGLFSKKVRRGVFIILSMPTSVYGFFLFICSKLGVVDRLIINISVDLFGILPALSTIHASGGIDSRFKEIFTLQIVVDGVLTIVSFVVIPLAVFLCGDKFLMKGVAIKKSGIILMAFIAVSLCVDFYIDGVGEGIFAQLLYGNSDICIINMGVYHAVPIILYYGAVSALVTMVKGSGFTDGKGGAGHG